MYELINSILQNDFFINLLAVYIATQSLDFNLKILKRKFCDHGLEWQMLDCIEKAHFTTCEQLGWAQNPDAFLKEFLGYMSSSNLAFSQSMLMKILKKAVGHPVNSEDIECWIHCFQVQLSLSDHEQLRELLKVQQLFKEKPITDVQKKYIERFDQLQFSNGNSLLTLADIYIINQFKISNSEMIYNDLINLIEMFADGNINEWLRKKNIDHKDKVNALFIFAHQCTGKSTLISKIVSDYYKNNFLIDIRLFLISFSDRIFRNKELNIESIINYLNITKENLEKSLLIIDGLDESELSCSEATIKLEDLIYDLQEINCHLIITSRPNKLLTSDLRYTLDVQLQPFSCEQAKVWLERYQAIFKSYNTEDMYMQIMSLPTSIQEVILIPYIFQMCIICNIAIDQITELAKLYDLLFDGSNCEFAVTPYNAKPRHKVSEWKAFLIEITSISIAYFNSPEGVIPENKLCNGEKLTSKMKTEFFLYQKANGNYTFIHDSIPNYFIARYLYNAVIDSDLRTGYDALIVALNTIIGSDLILTTAITDFVEYFVRVNHMASIDRPLQILKDFLSNRLNDKLTISGNLQRVQSYYYQYFISIMRLVFAFVSPNVGFFSQFDLFNLLTEDQKNTLIYYSNFGKTSLDCLKICAFSNKYFDGINLYGTNFRCKVMKSVTMRYAKFREANLAATYLSNSDFTLSDFENAHCQNADFSNCILFETSFKNARLNGVDFSNAILTNADLRGAKLHKAKFNGANMNGVKILSEQLRDIRDLDIRFIKENKIKVYLEDCLVPDSILDDEFKKQRPINYLFYREGKTAFNNVDAVYKITVEFALLNNCVTSKNINISSRLKLRDVLNEIYFILDGRVKAFTYLKEWLLQEKKSGSKLVVSDMNTCMPAYDIFKKDSVWSVVFLHEPYKPNNSFNK